MPYVVAVLAGVAVAWCRVADQTLTEIRHGQSTIGFRSPTYRNYLICMAIAVLIVLASGLYLFAQAGKHIWPAFIVLTVVGLLSYAAFSRLDEAVKRRHESS